MRDLPVDALAALTLIGVGLQLTLGDLQVRLGDDLVEAVGTTAELLACITVAAQFL